MENLYMESYVNEFEYEQIELNAACHVIQDQYMNLMASVANVYAEADDGESSASKEDGFFKRLWSNFKKFIKAIIDFIKKVCKKVIDFMLKPFSFKVKAGSKSSGGGGGSSSSSSSDAGKAISQEIINQDGKETAESIKSVIAYCRSGEYDVKYREKAGNDFIDSKTVISESKIENYKTISDINKFITEMKRNGIPTEAQHISNLNSIKADDMKVHSNFKLKYHSLADNGDIELAYSTALFAMRIIVILDSFLVRLTRCENDKDVKLLLLAMLNADNVKLKGKLGFNKSELMFNYDKKAKYDLSDSILDKITISGVKATDISNSWTYFIYSMYDGTARQVIKNIKYNLEGTSITALEGILQKEKDIGNLDKMNKILNNNLVDASIIDKTFKEHILGTADKKLSEIITEVKDNAGVIRSSVGAYTTTLKNQMTILNDIDNDYKGEDNARVKYIEDVQSKNKSISDSKLIITGAIKIARFVGNQISNTASIATQLYNRAQSIVNCESYIQSANKVMYMHDLYYDMCKKLIAKLEESDAEKNFNTDKDTIQTAIDSLKEARIERAKAYNDAKAFFDAFIPDSD